MYGRALVANAWLAPRLLAREPSPAAATQYTAEMPQPASFLGGSVVVTGGMGALGTVLAQWLAGLGGCKLWLLGRTGRTGGLSRLMSWRSVEAAHSIAPTAATVDEASHFLCVQEATLCPLLSTSAAVQSPAARVTPQRLRRRLLCWSQLEQLAPCACKASCTQGQCWTAKSSPTSLLPPSERSLLVRSRISALGSCAAQLACTGAQGGWFPQPCSHEDLCAPSNAGKVYGAQNLLQLSSSAALSAFQFFSSLAAFSGAAGQASYAAANGTLDAWAHASQVGLAVSLAGLAMQMRHLDSSSTLHSSSPLSCQPVIVLLLLLAGPRPPGPGGAVGQLGRRRHGCAQQGLHRAHGAHGAWH